jgi:hypothetical protein
MSRFLVLHTPVTLAPSHPASWTAKVPTPPDAPMIRTSWPGRTRPWSRRPWSGETGQGHGRRVLEAMGSRLLGFSQELFDDTAPADPETQAAMLRQFAGPYPHIAELVTAITHDDASVVGQGCDDQFEFEFALDLMLDGLEGSGSLPGRRAGADPWRPEAFQPATSPVRLDANSGGYNGHQRVEEGPMPWRRPSWLIRWVGLTVARSALRRTLEANRLASDAPLAKVLTGPGRS